MYFSYWVNWSGRLRANLKVSVTLVRERLSLKSGYMCWGLVGIRVLFLAGIHGGFDAHIFLWTNFETYATQSLLSFIQPSRLTSRFFRFQEDHSSKLFHISPHRPYSYNVVLFTKHILYLPTPFCYPDV